jgi:hypothetical protein
MRAIRWLSGQITRAIRWLIGLLLARRTAVVVSILVSIIGLGLFLLYLADKNFAAKHSEIATRDAGRRAARVIAVGTRRASDFKGVHYWAPPILTICPRLDGKWDSSLTWGGATRYTGPRVEPGKTRIAIPQTANGELIMILPKSATDIHVAGTDADVVDVFTAKEIFKVVGPVFSPSLRVTERGAHTEVSFNPFATGIIEISGLVYSLSTIKFTLPSFEIDRKGLGRWDFELPFMHAFPGLSPGLGSAEFDARSRPGSAFGPAPTTAGLSVPLFWERYLVQFMESR